MKTFNRTLAKGALGTVAAGAMALATASPAMAKDRDGISAGDVIAGAVVIGGIAALAGAFDGDRKDRRYRDRDYRDRDYRGYPNAYGYRGGHGQQAVQRCITAVERQAQRAGYRYARVTEVRDVDRERRGWEIEGRIEVAGAYGYNQRRYKQRKPDRGKFTCDIRRGQIVDIDFKGIRGLR